MLILSAVILMISATALLSCSKSDDNNSNTTTKQLNGKWNYIREEALDANGNIVTTDIEENGACPLDFFEFNGNGSYVNTDYEYSTNANNCKGEESKGNWSLVDNVFIQKPSAGAEDSYNVLKLNGTEFEIQKPLSRDAAENYELNVVTLIYFFKKM